MEILAMAYYLFSLLFMVGNIEWDNFKSVLGKIAFFILVLMPFCWLAFPFILGINCKSKY